MWGARAISPATTIANDSPFSIWPLIYIANHGSSAVRCMRYWLGGGVVAVNLCTGPLATQDSCGALIPGLLCEDLVRLLNCTASLCSPVQGEYVCMLSSCPVCHQTAAWRQHETHAVLHTRHHHICGGARVCESHRPGSVSNRAPDVAQQSSELQLQLSLDAMWCIIVASSICLLYDHALHTSLTVLHNETHLAATPTFRSKKQSRRWHHATAFACTLLLRSGENCTRAHCSVCGAHCSPRCCTARK